MTPLFALRSTLPLLGLLVLCLTYSNLQAAGDHEHLSHNQETSRTKAQSPAGGQGLVGSREKPPLVDHEARDGHQDHGENGEHETQAPHDDHSRSEPPDSLHEDHEEPTPGNSHEDHEDHEGEGVSRNHGDHEGHEESSDGHEGHAGHEEASPFGPEQAIQAVEKDGRRFRLAPGSIKLLGLGSSPLKIEGGEVWIPHSALVRFQQHTGIYIQQDHWFELIEVQVLRRRGSNVLVRPESALPAAQLVVSGVPLLHVAHLQASGQGGKGHAH